MLLLPFAAGTVWAGQLNGRISDGSGEFGLGGATVKVVELNRSTVSDDTGRYRFGDLPAGQYTLVVSYPGTEDGQVTVDVPGEGSRRMDVALSPASGYTEEMVVVGQRASQAGALARQRSADSISSFLTRDAIGQFPDQNVTEAVRRLPGVSVQNDQGEGRFIVLRGLDPNLNSASVNGVRVTAPESDIRAVALDVVPSELVETIEVQKTLTPEMDADAIGGSVDIRTTSALDRSGPFLSITGTGSYNDLMDDWSPKIGVDASTIIDERFGISLGLSYYDRQLGSENVEAEDWTDANGATYAESIEMRNYDVNRERLGVSLGLDWRVTDTTTLYFRGVYSSFEDEEFRSRVSLDFGDAEPVSGNANQALFDLSGGEELEVVRDIKDRTETQEIDSYLFGGETFAGPWTFDYQLSFTHAEEDEPDSYDTTDFARVFEAGELQVEQRGLGGDSPRVVVPAAFQSAYTAAADYEFDGLEVVDGQAEDEETALRFNVARDFALDNGQGQIKFGLAHRAREKTYDLNLRLYDDYDGGDFLLSDVPGRVDFPLGQINPVPSASAVRRFIGNFADFELNVAETEFENAAASFEVDEDILAAYVQARIDIGRWRIVGGIRMEETENDIRGNQVEFVEEDATYNGVVLTEDTTFVTPVEFSKDDTQWFPSLNVRFEAADDLLLRAAAYRSLFRPNIEDLAPRFVVEQDDGDEREGEFGNPDLDPYTAWNFDVSAEWYFAENAVLQGGAFYKDIDDFIVRGVFEDFDYGGIFINEGVIPLNGDSAEVTGLELNYQQAMTHLPAPFDGLLLGVNYTYVDSEGDFGARTIDLPGTSEQVLNLVLGYEKGPLSVRLGWVYRDSYLDEVSSDGETDRFVDEHASLDLSVKYDVTENAQVFVEAINLTDEPFVAYLDTPDYGERAMQYEEYSFTLNVGFRATF